MWFGVDPLAEKYPEYGAYVYTANNPIRFIDPDGRDWTDGDGNPISKEDLKKVKVFIFFNPKAFKDQTEIMYKEAEAKYGKGSVAMSDVTTEKEFKNDWQNMSGSDIKEVDINHHGGPQTINLDHKKDEYITSTSNGKTPRGALATNLSDLGQPSGNVDNAQLNINTCHSNQTDRATEGSKSTLAGGFRANFSFKSIRTTAQGVSYFNLFKPNSPHPQDDSNWQYLNRPIIQNENSNRQGLRPR